MKRYSKSWISRLESTLVDDKDSKLVNVFNSKSSWNFSNEIIYYDDFLNAYAESAPQSLTIPDEYINEIGLEEHDFESKGSANNFNKEKSLSFKEFSNIINECFGTNLQNKKLYPSAGSLYCVVSLIYIFSSNSVQNIDDPGIYIHNPHNNSILLIKKLEKKDINDIKKQISSNEIISNLAFGYAVDINKSIAKYKVRGFRHSLIEVGLLAQNTRTTLWRYGLSELCWSGFNDFKLTNISGLSPKYSPLILFQWWGYDAFYS